MCYFALLRTGAIEAIIGVTLTPLENDQPLQRETNCHFVKSVFRHFFLNIRDPFRVQLSIILSLHHVLGVYCSV